MAVVLEAGLGFPSPPEGQIRPGGKLAPEGERTMGWLRWAWGVWKVRGSAVARQKGRACLMQCFCVCGAGAGKCSLPVTLPPPKLAVLTRWSCV